jgi:O-antigen/teichoic acid export membrane protein
MPYSIKLYYDKLHYEKYGGILIKFISAAGLIFISVGLLSNELFTLRIGGYELFNSVYKDGLIILPFILGGYFLNGINSFFSVYPFVSDKTYHFIFSDGVGFIINVILNIILIPYYGILGAGIATLVSFAAVTSYLYILSSKHIDIIYQAKKVLGLLLIIILMTVAGILLDNIIIDIIFLSLFIYIVFFILKLKPSGLIFNKGIQEPDQLK